MKLALAILVVLLIGIGVSHWPKGDQQESVNESARRVVPGAQVDSAPSLFRQKVPPFSPELSKAVAGLRASFQPGISRFVRARRMVAFDKLWQPDPPFAFFVSEIADPDSPPEYRAYLAGCIRKAGKSALPGEKDEIVSLLGQALQSPVIEAAAKPDLAHALIMFDERPESVSRIAALSDKCSEDRLRASFLAALTQSRHSKAALLTSAREMSENSNKWAASLAVIVPPLILSGDDFQTSTLERIFTDTQSMDLLQRSAQALARLPDAPTKDHLQYLLTTRFTQLSHTNKQ